jgi:Erg28 like protein
MGTFQVAVTSMGNAIQAYTTLSYTRRLYPGQPATSTSSSTKTTKTTTTVSETTSVPAASRPTVLNSATAQSHTSPVTPLSARTFGTWTFLVGVVRIYAAYHINEEPWYQLVIWTYLVALAHFMTEAFAYKTARPKGPWLAPTSVAVVSLVWLIVQYGSYVK